MNSRRVQQDLRATYDNLRFNLLIIYFPQLRRKKCTMLGSSFTIRTPLGILTNHLPGTGSNNLEYTLHHSPSSFRVQRSK
ncbi:hypothetical protein BRAS3809_5610006 [Bradyrhizobium sp. STM 3809]|nr:hypothetical protein BRAS3809_5610006 [Bradyrhizobium sp. STM 3809]